MSMFGFSQDVRNIWNKAQAYMSEDEKVMKALKIMKEKFKELSKELEQIPIKRYNPTGEQTNIMKSLMNML